MGFCLVEIRRLKRGFSHWAFSKAKINQWSKSKVGWVERVGFFVCGLKCLKRLAKL